MIPAPISTHPSRPRRRRFAVRRWPGWLMWLSLLSVGADAHIGPLLGITCVAPVGRGDHTPSSVHSRSPCRGRAPSPRWQGPSSHQFSVGSERLPHRVGADLCVRPDTPPPRTRPRADTQVGPYGFNRNTHQPQKSGRGQSPAPTDSIAASINPGKQDAFPQNPQTNSPFSILPLPQFSPASHEQNFKI